MRNNAALSYRQLSLSNSKGEIVHQRDGDTSPEQSQAAACREYDEGRYKIVVKKIVVQIGLFGDEFTSEIYVPYDVDVWSRLSGQRGAG
jgi:hypothetical protein